MDLQERTGLLCGLAVALSVNIAVSSALRSKSSQSRREGCVIFYARSLLSTSSGGGAWPAARCGVRAGA